MGGARAGRGRSSRGENDVCGLKENWVRMPAPAELRGGCGSRSLSYSLAC